MSSPLFSCYIIAPFIDVVIMNIKISDIPIRWPEPHKAFVSDFEAESDSSLTPEFTLTVAPGISQCHGIEFADVTTAHFLHSHARSSEFLFANADWSEATLNSDCYTDENYALPLAALCARAAYFCTLFLHGALVDLDGNGVVFTGYSGVGKTTQAQLWEKYLGADIINGDKLFLRCIEGKAYAYGTPWKGSSPYCLNRKVPVKAVVVLQQAKENTIEKLDSLACMEYFMPHLFLPHWDQTCLNRALDTFDQILGNVPVYLLKCRPDEDAVLMTKEQIYG